MASDSDVEAYLNQLSKKTYSLKKDVQSWGYSSSRPSSAEEKPDDDLALSYESGSPVRTDQSSLKHEKDVKAFISDVASYSKKHGGLKKTYPHDRFSSLEQKYLRKPSHSKGSENSKQHDNASVQEREELSSDKKVPKSTTKQKTDYSNYSRSKTRVISDDSSVDEELARYLNETSLIDNQRDESHAQKPKTRSSSEDNSMNEVLNLNNILAVEDILDQVTDNESKAHDDHKFESRVSSSPENNSLIDNSETVMRDAFLQKHDITRSKPLTSVKNNISRDSEQAKVHSTEKKGKNILSSSRNSLFYTNSQQGDSDHDKPMGILLTQSSTNVFHSSRRRSSIEFDTEGSARPKTSKRSSKAKGEMVKSELYSEHVAESVASSNQRSIAESVIGNQSTSAWVGESVEESLAVSVVQSLSEARKDTSEIISEAEESIPSKVYSQNGRKSSQDYSSKAKSLTKRSLSRRKKSEPSQQSDISESQDISDHRGITKESKRKPEKYRKSKHKKRKSKRRYRTSSSESSSSESFSDSEREWHRRHHPRSYGYKWKYAFKPWIEPPYTQPWFCPYHPHVSTTGILSHTLGPNAVEGLGGVGVKQLMQQQVALIRQFLNSQQSLYQAYTSILTSSYHYTSLSDTEKYIKERKPPLMFSEAFKQVEEEMKASK